MRHFPAIHPLILLLLAPATAASAGDLKIVKTLPGKFDDISKTGINLNIKGDQSAVIHTRVGNKVFRAGRVTVSNNGGVGFQVKHDFLDPNNQQIPSNGAFGKGQGLLPYWDDIGNDVGGVFWREKETDDGDDVLIIQWHNRLLEGTPDPVRFQLQIFDVDEPNPVPIYAQLLYDDIERPGPDGGAGATIGYQDGGRGFDDVQWSFNMPKAVSNGTVLSVIPEPGTQVLALLASVVIRRRG